MCGLYTFIEYENLKIGEYGSVGLFFLELGTKELIIRKMRQDLKENHTTIM